MQQQVKVGTATVAGLGTSTAAYGLAIANYIAGDRSQDTYAALAVGTIALVTTLAGRFAQAVQHAKKATPDPAAILSPSTQFVSGTTTTSTRPSATVSSLATPPRRKSRAKPKPPAQ